MLQSVLNGMHVFNFILTFPLVTGAVGWTPDTRNDRHKSYGEDYEFDEHYRIRVSHAGKRIDSTLTKESERYGNIEVTVYAFRETFVLDLKLNTYMFASTYVEKSITNSGTTFHDVNHKQNHCYYIGTVRDRVLSTAAASTCKGIVGYFAVGNVSYHIEPLSDRLHGPHVVYRSREKSRTTYGCGTEHIVLRNLMHTAKSGSRLKRSFQWPQDEDEKDKVVEVYIANDKSQFDARSGDSTAVFQRAKDIVNIASSAYQPLGIYPVLVGMEVWTSTNPFAVQSSNVQTTLTDWLDYRLRNINPIHYNDDAILLTNTPFSNGVVGLSIIGSMCSNLYSGAIVSDVSSSSAVAGSTLAHEMGHNFGLVHDSDSCACVDRGGHCIMYASSNPSVPATNWSSCSIEQFQASFRQGLDLCLYNVPQTLYQPTVSRCGNGIVEDGEECDCGNAPSVECNSACCSSSTCKLTVTSTCAAGRCCDVSKCQILSSGTVCRQKVSDCDLTEYCDGQGPLCPPDTHKLDGTNCTVNGNNVFCYDGLCRSHQTQCQLLWGPGTPVSSPICYHQFNVNGAHYGNCGLNWLPNVSFIPCAPSDVMCGKLMCDTTGKNLYTYTNFYVSSPVSIGNYICNSIIFDFGLKTQDPGLVPNGASCGDGMMCVSQKCVSSQNVMNNICDRPCDSNEECNMGICQTVNPVDVSPTPSISAITSGTTTSSTTTAIAVIIALSHFDM